jgi:hypothetical protein
LEEAEREAENGTIWWTDPLLEPCSKTRVQADKVGRPSRRERRLGEGWEKLGKLEEGRGWRRRL